MKLSPVRHLQKGFTLIELLVVIGILGILAAALVATIDPFEQLRKATDSRAQNTSVELHGALVRYYTTHENMPWENGACDIGAGAVDVPVDTTVEDLIGVGCIDVLIAEGELKQAFTTAQGLDELYIIEPYETTSGVTAVDGSPAVCYIPESRSGKADDNTRYNRAGFVDGACIDTGTGANTCHWCAE